MNTNTDTEPPSKSQLKREATRLQHLGKRLTELKADQLEALDLSEQLLHAIHEHHRFTSRGAKHRQLQFIGRVMRDIDAAALTEQLEQLQGNTGQSKHTHHAVEQWRARLVDDPQALTQFIVAHPTTDRQQLRHLIKKILRQPDEPTRKLLNRELFRFIRTTLEQA